MTETPFVDLISSIAPYVMRIGRECQTDAIMLCTTMFGPDIMHSATFNDLRNRTFSGTWTWFPDGRETVFTFVHERDALRFKGSLA